MNFRKIKKCHYRYFNYIMEVKRFFIFMIIEESGSEKNFER